MSPADVESVHHIARLAFLAMAARGVAESEFEQDAEITSVQITVTRSGDGQTPVSLEYISLSGFPVGGMSL